MTVYMTNKVRTYVHISCHDQLVTSVKRQMQNLSANIGAQIKPVFQRKKIGQVLAPQ